MQCGRSFITASPNRFINLPTTGRETVAQTQPEAAAQPQAQPAATEMMERICPGCGAINGENDRFCSKCGLALDAPTPATARKQINAGFMIRLGAYLVDQIVLFLIGFVVLSLLIEALNPGVTSNEDELSAVQLVITYAVGIALNMLYYTITVGKWGRTIGKQIFGLQVLTADGKRVSYLKAFVRSFGYYISAFTLFFGFLMIAWNKQARGLHDLLAGTIVIRRNL